MTFVSRSSQALRSLPRLGACCFALATAQVMFGHTALALEIVEVQLDAARTIGLPANVATLVLGNPSVADITAIKNGSTIVITGKGFGETNLIALDAQGKMLAESTIRVVPSKGKLLVQRGMDRQSYSCLPTCQPTLSLGDDAKYSGEVAAQIGARNSASAPGASSAPPPAAH